MAGIRASAVGWGLTKLDDPAISANPAGPMAVAAARERYGTGSQRRTILMMPQTTASQATSPGTRVTRIITRDRKLIRNAPRSPPKRVTRWLATSIIAPSAPALSSAEDELPSPIKLF